MTFTELSKKIVAQFNLMQQYPLFRVGVSNLWDTYISSFEEGDDPVFRDPNSTSHTCNRDRHFISTYGDIVAVNGDEIITLWDIEVEKPYASPINALRDAVKNSPIIDKLVITKDYLNKLPYEKVTKAPYKLGYDRTLKRYTPEEAAKYGVVNAEDIYEFSHFHVFINDIDTSGKSIESVVGSYRSNYDVLKRGLSEIPKDTLELVLDLITQGSLLNAESYLKSVRDFLDMKLKYDKVINKDYFVWTAAGNYNAKFRNTLAGLLCVELAEGKELNDACRDWNKRADPANYMKASAPITASMIKAAEEKAAELGYTFNRRFATIDDIDVNEIIHQNDDSSVKQAGLFAGVKPSASTRHKRSQFDGISEVSIEKFMAEILPKSNSIEVFVENRFEDNFVSLITGDDNMFKWNNRFSWTYRNNLTGKSEIAQNVAKAGGKIDGILRFSIQWNENGNSICDLDAHCVQPNGREIYYANFKRPNKSTLGGQLDVDMIRPTTVGVENITFDSWDKLAVGKYVFKVVNFDSRDNDGCRAEIAFNGEVYSYNYNRNLKNTVEFATVTVKPNRVIEIEHHVESTESNKEIWGIETNQFHKVNLVCLSPNYWGDNNVGNKHYFFFLKDAKSDIPLRPFHNEYLNNTLRDHRKVLEVFAHTKKLHPADKQLAGLGFNATVRDELIVKIKGTHERVLKIKL